MCAETRQSPVPTGTSQKQRGRQVARTLHTGSADSKSYWGRGKLCALETKAVEKRAYIFRGKGADPPLARIILRPALRYSWFPGLEGLGLVSQCWG